METITVQVIYEKGVLKPKSKLPYPEKSVLEAQVQLVKVKKEENFRSLIGIWAGLSDVELNALEKELGKARQTTSLKMKQILSK